MSYFSTLSLQPVFYNGELVIGAKIFVYDAGTNTARAAYTNEALTVPHTAPFLTDANGVIPPFWVTSGAAIKVVLKNPDDTVIRTVDGIPTDAGGLTPMSSAAFRDYITDETGTGALVFANSPTLVSPALGTPSSATLTNASGLPVSGISATGTPSNSTYLRGDGSWQTVSVAPGGSTTQIQFNNAGAFAGSSNFTFDGANASLAGTLAMGSSFLRNRIINGGMRIDQRNAGASQTITAGSALAYTVDRWYAYCTGANVTGQRVSSAGTADSPAQNAYRFTGAASVTAIGFGQRIEAVNCFDLAGQTATLSVSLANSVLTTVTWTAFYANTTDTFGTLSSPTVTQIATGTFTVNSTLARYTANISIPAAATTGIQIVFTVGAQTSGTWTVGNVQLERGSVATPFERRQYGTELMLCQRYYQTFIAQWTGWGGDGNAYFQIYPLQCPMRVTPTSSSTISGQTNQLATYPRIAGQDAASYILTLATGSNPIIMSASYVAKFSAEL